MYNKDSLKEGIEQAKKNIETFKGVIQKEKDTIVEYEGYIKDIEKRDKDQKEFNKKVEVTRE